LYAYAIPDGSICANARPGTDAINDRRPVVSEMA
jgi:hypothetical protein